MKKILNTSGCSFSECVTYIAGNGTWPRHLAKTLEEHEHVSYAMGSQGNGLISRSIIYGVTKALQTYKPEDILVGVMWSGSNRHDFRCFEVDFSTLVFSRASLQLLTSKYCMLLIHCAFSASCTNHLHRLS